MTAVNWLRVVLLLGLVSRLCVGAEAASLYTIGNSLTNDMVPEGVAALAVDSGIPATVGFHIRAASSLTYIVANPGDATFTLGGAWNAALRDATWDHVTMQPYRGTGSTLASEKAAMKTLIDLARSGPSARARFYVYAAWPSQEETGGNFAEYWRQPVSTQDSQPTTLARAYFDELHRQLVQDYRSVADIRVIPVGDVLLRLDEDFRAGRFPGIASINDLYRDPVHMGDVGRFAAAAAVHCTIFGRAPQVAGALAIYQGGLGGIPLTPELATKVAGIACDVVASDPRTKAAAPVEPDRSSGGGGSTGLDALLALALLAAGRRTRRRRQATTPWRRSIQRRAAASNE